MYTFFGKKNLGKKKSVNNEETTTTKKRCKIIKKKKSSFFCENSWREKISSSGNLYSDFFSKNFGFLKIYL